MRIPEGGTSIRPGIGRPAKRDPGTPCPSVRRPFRPAPATIRQRTADHPGKPVSRLIPSKNPDHKSRSDRYIWGVWLVAGLGSQFPRIPAYSHINFPADPIRVNFPINSCEFVVSPGSRVSGLRVCHFVSKHAPSRTTSNQIAPLNSRHIPSVSIRVYLWLNSGRIQSSPWLAFPNGA
jgi:hypothetical protein